MGTHGYPDCVAGPGGVTADIEANQMTMVCKQRAGAPGTLKIAAVGDSITAGAHSSGGIHPYPQQLQLMLDPTKYTVTNLGACGSTMQKDADSPYWKRPQFSALTAPGVTWDIVVIMLCVVVVGCARHARFSSVHLTLSPLLPSSQCPSSQCEVALMIVKMLLMAAPATGCAART